MACNQLQDFIVFDAFVLERRCMLYCKWLFYSI